MARQFYTYAKEAMAEMDAMLTSLEKATTMNEISRLEVTIRKKAEEIMVYAGMIPNKDVTSISYSKRREIRDSVLSTQARIRKIIAEQETAEEPVVDKPNEAASDKPAKKVSKKKSTKKKGK